VFVAGVHAGDIDLFPLDGHVVRFEHCFDGFGYFGADSVTCTRKVLVRVTEVWFSERAVVFVVPGIKVTVYFPPYFVGLKISDSTVA
jgi:hypothetical protein